MKKVYLSIIFCLCAFAGFSATWYSSNPGGAGDATNLNNWWSSADSTGTNPAVFSNPGDTFIMQTNMICSTNLTIAGYMVINNVIFNVYSTVSSLSIGHDLILTGGADLNVPNEGDGSGNLILSLSGNLNVLDSSFFTNPPENTFIVFNNTSSTILSPQTITWTSTAIGNWTTITINANCVVQLLSNVTLPSPTGYPDIVNGTLICGNYQLNCNNTYAGDPFQLNDGASLYTANIYGIDSSILDVAYSFSSFANYIFNGSAHQSTGVLLPGSFNSGGSVTVSNAAGVTLSQSTTFNNGSTLALTHGNLWIGAAELNLGVTASFTGPFSDTNMIVTNGAGMLQKQFNDNGSFLYPVGDTASHYTPISLSVASDEEYSEGAYVGANVTPSKDPNNHNITNFLNRYWSVTAVGLSSPFSYTIDSATYVPGDVVGTEGNISMGQFPGTLPWVKFGPANTVNHSLSSPSIANNNSSDFTGISTAAPTVSIPHGIALCNGDTATISVISVATDTPFTYVWAPSTALSATTGSSVMTTTTSNITYTLTVTDANGFTATDTSAVTVNPKPNVDTVTGGGIYCSGAGGLHVGLNSSDTGVNYQLLLNDTATGSPVAGTDTAIDFGLKTLAGTYTVVATNATTGCTMPMWGNVMIIVNPSPLIDTVTGGGSYCMGATGVHIGLSGTTAGITYQLYNGLSTADTPVTGTGTPLDFGLYTDGGTYTVVATSTVNACTTDMADSAKVVVNSLPPIHTVTGGGNYCAGGIGRHVGLNGSDTGIHYHLYLGVTATGSAVAGTESALDFGLETLAGTYTATATNDTTGCMSNMSGGTIVTIIPVVIPSVSIETSIPDSMICAGTSVIFSADAVHAGGEPGYQWSVNDTVVGYSSSYSYIPVNGNVVSIRLISDEECAMPDTVTDTMTVVVSPHQTPTITLTVAPGDTICQGTSVAISAATTYSGPEPSYTWVKHAVVVSTDSFYDYTPANGDDIYCILVSDYFCLATATAYSNVINMIVETPIVPSVSIVAYPSTIIHTGKPDSLVAVVTNGGSDPSYQWYVNSTLQVGATTASFSKSSFTDRDSVSVQVTRRDACNLSNFTSVVLAVNDLDVKQVTSGVNDIKLVPNPNNGTFTITGSTGAPGGADEAVSIEITNMLGQVVYKAAAVSHNGEINELIQTNNTLANGIYLLSLKSESGNSTIRFVVGQ